MNEAAAVLFAAAIQFGGYTDHCKQNECKPPARILVDAHVAQQVAPGKNGWYNQGNAYVRERSPQGMEFTTFHEYIHHLQSLSNRYQQYRGVCNKWLAEKEAYEATNAYAQTKGYQVRYEHALAPYEQKCKAAVAAGLVKDPATYTK